MNILVDQLYLVYIIICSFFGQFIKGEENHIIPYTKIINSLGLINYEDKEKEILKIGKFKKGEIKQLIKGRDLIILIEAEDSVSASTTSIFENL